MKKKGKIIVIILAIGAFVTPIIQNVISHKIEDFDYMEMLKVFWNEICLVINKFAMIKVPIWIILLLLLSVIIINIMINKIKNLKIARVNIKNLSIKEKNIIKKFYVEELKLFTNKSRRLASYDNTIELLVERGIIKEPIYEELIDTYSSGGSLYNLTDEAIKILNHNRKLVK